MRSLFLLLCLTLSLSHFPLSGASTSNPEKWRPQPTSTSAAALKAYVDYIEQVFESQYAPQLWKESYLGWNVHEQADKVRQAIDHFDTQTLSRDERILHFHRALKKFFIGTQDLHVRVCFEATGSAAIALSMDYAEGDRFIVTHSGVPGVRKGDEVLEINGRPAVDAIREYCEENLGSFERPFYRRMATRCFTLRSAANGEALPKGLLELGILDRQGIRRNILTPWVQIPETIYANKQKEKIETAEVAVSDKNPPLEGENDTNPHEEADHPWQKKLDILKAHFPENEAYAFSIRGAPHPLIGYKVIWSEKAGDNYHFNAALLQGPAASRIGLIKLPIYQHSRMNQSYKESAKSFAELVARFEEESDLLIIDQKENRGGSLHYLLGLASTLSESPLKQAKHSITLTPSSVSSGLDSIEKYGKALKLCRTDAAVQAFLGSDSYLGRPLSLELIRGLYQSAKDKVRYWEEGYNSTPFMFVDGCEYCPAHPTVAYTKPILVLIDDQCVSGGDFFPALLQDNKRAKLFGNQTAGAGGFVLDYKFPNAVGIASFRLTASLAIRDNGDPIEDLGVTPDFFHEQTVNDLRHNNRDFKKSLDKAIKVMLEFEEDEEE